MNEENVLKRLVESELQDASLSVDAKKMSGDDIILLWDYLVKIAAKGHIKVYTTSNISRTQLSVKGELCVRPTDPTNFRVLVDSATYAYFTVYDIAEVITNRTGFPDDVWGIIKIII